MDITTILLFSALGLAVNCLIMYLIIRSSTRAALEDVLSQLIVNGTPGKELQKIRELLEKAHKPAVTVSASTLKPVDPVPTHVPTGAHLIDIADGQARCSACGRQQRSNRTVCLDCGVKFNSEDAEVGQV